MVRRSKAAPLGRAGAAWVWTTKRHPLAIALVLTAIVGVLDYVSGTQLRLFPLYFIPLAFVASSQSRPRTLVAAGLASLVWATSNYDEHDLPIYVGNVFSQAVAFTFVAILVNALKQRGDLHKKLALTDALTGLLNARAFMAAAERELSRQRRKKTVLAMAYLDVDDFKKVNSILGHLGADDVLRECAQAMRRALRASDVIGRMGGDEFAILLPDTAPDQVDKVLQRLRSEVLRANEGRKMAITVSVGAVVFPEPASSVNAMLELSDDLMYSVKGGQKDGAQVRSAAELLPS